MQAPVRSVTHQVEAVFPLEQASRKHQYRRTVWKQSFPLEQVQTHQVEAVFPLEQASCKHHYTHTM